MMKRNKDRSNQGQNIEGMTSAPISTEKAQNARNHALINTLPESYSQSAQPVLVRGSAISPAVSSAAVVGVAAAVALEAAGVFVASPAPSRGGSHAARRSGARSTREKRIVRVMRRSLKSQPQSLKRHGIY